MKGTWKAGSLVFVLALGACTAARPEDMADLGAADTAAAQETMAPGAARRVILIVGDGVGLAQWSLLRLAGTADLAVARLPEVGLVDTRCACARTTDSGAAATAYATATRTQYRFVGMAPDSTPRETVLEAAEQRGLATGLVTTTHITDATPAAFGAHVVSRYDHRTIAAQLAEREIEVLLGGGYAYFARRPDGRDLVRELAARYRVVRTPAEFAALDVADTERVLGLFADSTMYGEPGVRPPLPALARTALAILERDPDGFFLLLESEDTDEVFHDTLSAAAALPALRELDATIAVALEFQARHPETLIVVIGDHETGGLAVHLPRETGALTTMYTTTDHTAGMVPVFAGGPGAAGFGRWLTNEQVGALLFAAVGAPRAAR